MKRYELDKMAFEYIHKSINSSYINEYFKNEIFMKLESNIILSEEEMSYLITAITFNKELVDSYRNYLIEVLENPIEKDEEGAFA